ncbi:MAG: C40 family peptidase [Flavobacteriales bacterium]|nr:C40 family peptidase [Flavobacteriales bacterium]PIE86550.1 MAG: hypothetical protein CSA03_04745 [Bacteroidota bacterium]
MYKSFKIFLVVVFVFSLSAAFGQNKHFDRLEMYYSQGHYKRTYRKAGRLLDKPEYDYSMMPTYYRSISLFQLCQNGFWLSRHPEALKDAERMFNEVKRSEVGTKIFNAHMYELSWLRSDMISWAGDLKRMGDQDGFEEVQDLIDRLFEEVPNVDAGNDANQVAIETDPNEVESVEIIGLRGEILTVAKQQIGTPYVWAGNKPGGFDCSGFTSYVMEQNGMQLPRRAADQYASSKKLKAKEVQKGDLVFFNNGSGISHVGIVVSEKGRPLQMIHASSGSGIIITNVEKSEYWMKRLHGYGTYVK